MGQEDPLKEGKTIHSNIIAWKIPRTEEPGRLQSLGLKESNKNTTGEKQQIILTCLTLPQPSSWPLMLLAKHIVCMLSCFSNVRLFAIPWTVACQAPLSVGFSRQECWSGLPCLPPGDLPYLWMEPASLMSPVLAGEIFTTSATWEAPSFS